MNLKRRLILANAATVVIPLALTALVALVAVFLFGKLSPGDLSLANYQRLSQIRLEVQAEKSILEQAPEAEQREFQQYLQELLKSVQGEVVMLKADRLLFASRDLSKIELAQLTEAGNIRGLSASVRLGETAYTVQSVPLHFGDGSKGSIFLLAPLDEVEGKLKGFLVFLALLYITLFTLTNAYISYRFSRSIIVPLKNLQKAAAEISRGNLDYQIVEEGDAELQELCRDLELMRIRLKDSIHTELKYEANRKMLISSISHDLKTPVTSIKGYVEGILDGVAQSPEKNKRYLQTIAAKAQQVDQMIDDLLLYAKLDLHELPFNFEWTDIEAYVRDCVQESEPEFEQAGIRLDWHSDLKQKQDVLLDRERMKRVFMNILDNARKYVDKPEPKVEIMLRETPTSVIIEFLDNGSGISEKDLPSIFERFYRADAARTQGSGLGLAIAKQIVEGHNGRIWAVSHEHEGTSILISLSKRSFGNA